MMIMTIMTFMTFRRGDVLGGMLGRGANWAEWSVKDVAGRLLCLVSLFFWGWR